MDNKESLDRIGPRIAVVGVGGAGGNAVDNMIRSGLSGVTFLICNTDAQALSQSLCPESQRICLGFGVTQGLGAGSSPEIGRLAAEESVDEVMRHLQGVHMLFVTAGMGGGTGTGSGPVIAKAAKEQGILTVGVVTKPFHFEGTQRMRAAQRGIEIIRDCVDTLLVIHNQNLFRLATRNTTFVEAFFMADDVLYSGVRTFTDLMIKPGLVNSDFADICTIMRNMKGKAMMGTGESNVEGGRATEASEKAIACLLLDDVFIGGAQAVLINVTGGPDLTLYDVDEAVGRIKQEVDQEIPGRDPPQIIFGATFDKDLAGTVRVSVVATGIQDTVEEGAVPSTKKPEPEPDEESISYHSLGTRHEDAMAFEESPARSFSFQEDAEEFGAPEPAKPERKRSFFEKLTGLGRRKEVRSPYVELEKGWDKDPSPFPGKDELDIPSFLRKNNK